MRCWRSRKILREILGKFPCRCLVEHRRESAHCYYIFKTNFSDADRNIRHILELKKNFSITYLSRMWKSFMSAMLFYYFQFFLSSPLVKCTAQWVHVKWAQFLAHLHSVLILFRKSNGFFLTLIGPSYSIPTDTHLSKRQPRHTNFSSTNHFFMSTVRKISFSKPIS